MRGDVRTLPGIKSWGRVKRAAHVFTDAADFDDDFPPGFMDAHPIARRVSQSMPGLPPAEFATLDSMIETHGLAKVLRSLRECLDCRAHVDACDENFTDSEGADVFQAQADAVEELIAKVRP